MDTSIHSDTPTREPWNKGKVIGAKPPLRPKHVWAVRTRLQLSGRFRDLALFNLAIDSKLRGCDVVSVKMVDVAPHGYALDRASVRQRKTGRPVQPHEKGHELDHIIRVPFARHATNSLCKAKRLRSRRPSISPACAAAFQARSAASGTRRMRKSPLPGA
jgi:hypothetical protein